MNDSRSLRAPTALSLPDPPRNSAERMLGSSGRRGCGPRSRRSETTRPHSPSQYNATAAMACLPFLPTKLARLRCCASTDLPRPVMYVEPSRIHILPRLAGLDQRRTDALRDERPRSRHSTARTAPAAGSAARVSSIENETPKKGHRRQAPETALR